MLSDIFVVTGFGLIAPILAIFIKEDLVGGTIFAAGLASTIYLVSKCIVQLPFHIISFPCRYIPDHNWQKDVQGTVLITLNKYSQHW